MTLTRPSNKLVTASQVAWLYRVHKATVHRWFADGLFTHTPVIMPSPSGTRDRVLFNSDDIARQYADEMIKGYDPGPERDANERRLEEFLR